MGLLCALCLVVYLDGQALSIANTQTEGKSAGLVATFLFVFVLLLTGVIAAALSLKKVKQRMWARFAPAGTRTGSERERERERDSAREKCQTKPNLSPSSSLSRAVSASYLRRTLCHG